MMNKFTIVFVLLCILCSSTAMAGEKNAPNSNFEGSAWAEGIKKRGVLKVGFDTFVPWAMRNKEGNFIGFEIDVATALANDLGVKVQFVPTAWNGIIPALLTGKFDVLIGGMSITPERAKKVLFTEPYEYLGLAIAASRITAPDLNSLDDFNKKNINISVRLGTTAELTTRKMFPNANILAFSDEGQAAQELRNGKAQAFVSAAPLPAQLALKHQKEIYIPVTGVFTKEPIGMALSPKSKDALPFLNAWIKSRFESKWLEERWHYWFETLDWETELK